MQLTTRKITLGTHALLLPAFLFITSCGVMEQAMRSSAADDEVLIAMEEPQFIEDFYEPEVSRIETPMVEAISFRGDLRTGVCDEEAIAARELTYNLDNLPGMSNIGGGEEEATVDLTDETELDEITMNAMENGRFNPSKMEGKLVIDVLMEETSCYNFPLDNLRINSNFGWRRGRVHAGIDLDLETGDPVYAIIDGVVKEAAYSKGYGNLVILEHANGLQTYYAHLSKINVNAGDMIASGEQLGLGGSTGRSTGPHLHFEVRYHGAYMDPSNLIDFKTGELKSTALTLEKGTFKTLNDVNTAKYHTVRSGDTLSGIASKYGTSVSKICRLNGISAKKVIRPGQRLRVR